METAREKINHELDQLSRIFLFSNLRKLIQFVARRNKIIFTSWFMAVNEYVFSRLNKPVWRWRSQQRLDLLFVKPAY